MLRRKRKYIVMFTIIVFAWAIGMGWLILSQIGKKSQEASETNASYETPAAQSSGDNSQFGKLLK